MNLQLTHSTTATAPSPFKKRYLAAAAGGVLMVAAVAGIGTLRIAGRVSTARTGSPTASVAGLVAPPAANAPSPFTYYLVSSQE